MKLCQPIRRNNDLTLFPRKTNAVMLLGDILNVCLLMFGSAFCVILGKCLLKFYSTILFADINIFTHLNKAAVIAIQLMVQSRVGVGRDFTTHVQKDIFTRLWLK